jgi:8-oxo-dGTP pyrophosphatase MutT (NUDIX family)
MGKEKEKKDKLIKASGGLLWRKTPGGLKIAVVHRHRYGDDWTLPKGKLIRGESWQEAALREVKEQTGWDASIMGFAGAIVYQTELGDKVVRFWNMTTTSGEHQSDLIGDEVVKVVWLLPGKAIKRLSYPLEKAIVEVWRKKINLELGSTPRIIPRCKTDERVNSPCH